MAYKKTEEFTPEEVFLSEVAKSLSHPARIRILEILNENSCICGDIVDKLPLSQSTVSQHLKELKNSGLIKGEVEGPKTCYCVNADFLIEVKQSFDKLFNKLKKCC